MDNEVIFLNNEVKLKEVSSLFNIDPIGVGSGYTESLTSYLVRLANAHSVSVGDLMNHIVGPILDKSYVVRSAVNGGNRFYDGAKSLNGIDKNSKDLAATLGTLTSRSDLVKLTFNKWEYVLTNRNLLKNHLAWCPECLYSFEKVYGSSYLPLLWSVKSICSCKIHQKKLINKCPGCKNNIPVLHRRSNNVNCPYCEVELKSARHDEECQISEFELFTIDNTHKIIEYMENLDYKLNKDVITKSFNFFEHFFKITYNKSLRKELEIPKSTYYHWKNGKSIPTIENLFKFCYSIGISIEEFFFCENVKFIECVVKSSFKSVGVTKRNKLNYEKINNQLNSFMSCDHPLSMEEISRIIMVPKRTLYRKFPDLCKNLSKRYMEEIKNRSLNRRVHVESLIEKSVIELNDMKLFPTQKRIETHLLATNLLREGFAKEYLTKCLESIERS